MQTDISLPTIPPYLASSKFLEGWEDNDEVVLVCQSVLKPDASVSDDEDLFQLLNSLRYWIVESIPDSVVAYVLSQPDNRCQQVLQEFACDLPCANDLLVLTNLSGSGRWNMALQLGNLSCVQYLHENGFSCDSLQSCDIAAKVSSLPCLEYLHNNSFPWNAQTSENAAGSGNVSCLSYLHENGCLWDASTTIASARYGRVDCLSYALKRGCAYHSDAALYAAANGHVSCLKIIINLHVPTNSDSSWLMRLAEVAAAHKQFDCLQYLYAEQNCPLDHWPLVMAAKSGCLKCLQYLHGRGCEWDEHVTIAAAFHGHINCLRYAIENECECNVVAMYFHGVKGNDVIDYLKSLGMSDPWLHTDDEGDSDESKEEEKNEEEVIVKEGSDAYWGLDELIPTPSK